MQVHVYEKPSEEGQPHYRFLCSDLHLGSSYVDEAQIDADFANARQANADILINGDLWDAIGPGDRRFTASCLHREVRGREDLSGELVKLAFRKLEPVADLIREIGVGNHEEAWAKYRLDDMTARLIEKLNDHLERQGCPNRIRHGGVSGFVVTLFKMGYGGDCRGPSVAHRLLYQHGSGGDSPVTKGSIDAYRRGNSFEYDCLTFGHKHNATFIRDVVTTVSVNGHIRDRERFCIQTASYLKNIVRTGQKRPLDYSYAESGHHPSKPLGGAFLVMTPVRSYAAAPNGKSKRSSLWRVRQDFMTRYIPHGKAQRASATRVTAGRPEGDE